MKSRPRRFWAKLGGVVALGYYSLAVTLLLAESHSESTKLHRGMYTDTVNPLAFSEAFTWPSSRFIARWRGYPERFDQSVWQKALNDSLPSHLEALVVQALLGFAIIAAWGLLSELTRSRRSRRRSGRLVKRKSRRARADVQLPGGPAR
jgi:hypothetical protein